MKKAVAIGELYLRLYKTFRSILRYTEDPCGSRNPRKSFEKEVVIASVP